MSKSSDVAFGRQGGRGVRYTKDDCAGPVLPENVARARCSSGGCRFLIARKDLGHQCPCGDGILVERKAAA